MGTLILPSPVCRSDEISHVWSVAALWPYNLTDLLETDSTFPNTSTLEKLWTLLQGPLCPSSWLWGCLWGFHWHTEACFSPQHGKTMTSVERRAEILLRYHFTLMQPWLLTHLLVHWDPPLVVKWSYWKILTSILLHLNRLETSLLKISATLLLNPVCSFCILCQHCMAAELL